jgi:hypothetical protein
MPLLKYRGRYNTSEQREAVERLLWQQDQGEIGSIEEMTECCNLVSFIAYDNETDPLLIAVDVMKTHCDEIREIVYRKKKIRNEWR